MNILKQQIRLLNMKVLEMTDAEIEVYLKNKQDDIKRANERWEIERKYLLERALLRKEYEESIENPTSQGFDDFCRVRGLEEPFVNSDDDEVLIKDENDKSY